MRLNIGHLMTRRALLTPDREGLICGSVRRTNGELNERANRLAGAIEAYLGRELLDGEELAVGLTGALYSGASITGEDKVTVIKKGNKAHVKKVKRPATKKVKKTQIKKLKRPATKKIKN